MLQRSFGVFASGKTIRNRLTFFFVPLIRMESTSLPAQQNVQSPISISDPYRSQAPKSDPNLVLGLLPAPVVGRRPGNLDQPVYEHLLQNMLVQRYVRRQFLQLPFLFFELAQASKYGNSISLVFAFPPGKGFLGYSHLPAHLGHWSPGFRLTQHQDDLLLGKRLLQHDVLLDVRAAFFCE